MMTSSEKILAGIAEDAGQKTADILAQAEEQVEKIRKEAAEKAEQEAGILIEQAEKQAALIRSSGQSAAALLKRDAALQTRRELIDQALADTVESINGYDDATYFEFLFGLIQKTRLEGKGELLLSARDLTRDKTAFAEKLAAIGCTISDEATETGGGFILKYQDILINGSFKALLHEKREELVDQVNKTLFQSVSR